LQEKGDLPMKKKKTGFFDEFDTSSAFSAASEAVPESPKKQKKTKQPKAPKEPKPAKAHKSEASETKEKPPKKADKAPKAKKKAESSGTKKIQKMTSTQMFSPIREVRDGIIITKSGDFVKVLEFSSINFSLRNEFEQDSIITEYQSVIKLLPKNVQFKVLCKKTDISKYIGKIEADMRKEPVAACRKLQKNQIRLIQEMGTYQSISRRFLLMFKYEGTASARHVTWQDIRASLETTALRIQSAMHRIGNETVSDDSNEYTLRLLYEIMSRNQADSLSFQERLQKNVLKYMTDSGAAAEPKYLPVNDLIAPQYIDIKNAKYMIVDGLYYAFAYVPSASFPNAAAGGWASLFSTLGEGIDMDLFLVKQDTRTAQIKLQYAIRANKLSLRSKEDTSLDYEDAVSTVSSGYYLKEGLSSGDDMCYMALLLTITAHSKEALLAKIDEIKQFCITIDMQIKMADFQQDQAFLSSLPICSLNKNIFGKAKRNILGRDFASSYPFSSFEVSDENGIFLGINQSNNSMVFVDNFDSKRYVNPNMVILGTSGAGKSFSLMLTAERMRQRNIQVFIIAPDKGAEFKRLCDALGGVYVQISTGSSQNINVMEIRKADSEMSKILDGEDLFGSILSQKIQQLHTFFSLLIPDITHEEKQLLDEAMMNTYAGYGITDDNDSLFDPLRPGHYKEMPILGDLHKELLKKGQRTQRISTILSRFVTGSASSFNQRTNVDLDNKFVVLDVTNLTDEMLPMGMFIALDYVWDKAKEDRTKKKAIFIDEAWQLIGSGATPQSAKFVVRIFKVIRGYGGCAIAATQDLNDFFALEDGLYGKTIINNSKLKLILRLEPQEALAVREALDITEGEVKQCATFEPGEGILVANTDHVIIKVKASSEEAALITTKREDLEAQAKKKKAKMALSS
jgi:type IV secretory pathway VirB4 component